MIFNHLLTKLTMLDRHESWCRMTQQDFNIEQCDMFSFLSKSLFLHGIHHKLSTLHTWFHIELFPSSLWLDLGHCSIIELLLVEKCLLILRRILPHNAEHFLSANNLKLRESCKKSIQLKIRAVYEIVELEFRITIAKLAPSWVNNLIEKKYKIKSARKLLLTWNFHWNNSLWCFILILSLRTFRM